jgi:Flp pilus assembly protein TadG
MRYFAFLSTLTRRAKPTMPLKFLSRFVRDDRGSYIVLMAIGLPALVTIAGLGTEGGFWLYTHRVVQSAADNAAYSAATAYAIDNTVNVTSQGKGVSASNYNLVDGQNGVTVTVNMPPVGLCGATSYVGNANAVEVAVQESLGRFFSGILLPGNANICGQAVALITSSGDCILALAKTGQGVFTANKTNNLSVQMQNCNIFSNSSSSNALSLDGNNNSMSADAIGTVGDATMSGNWKTGINNLTTGDAAVADPYATQATSWPQTCSGTCTSQSFASLCPGSPTTCTLQPGVYNGLTLPGQSNNNSIYTMAPGIYYINGDLTFSGNHIQLNGTGVTIVLTGKIDAQSQNSSLNITAPSTGWNAGIAIFEPASDTSANVISGNSFVSSITGALYTPGATWNYAGNTGNTPTCTQIVAQQIQFSGNSVNFTGDCSGVPGAPKKFGQLVALVE